MATATSQRQAATQGAHSEPDSLRFAIFEDNSGGYRWTMLDADGATLAQSRAFVTYQDAEASAGSVRDGAGSARIEPRAAEEGAVAPVGGPHAAPASGYLDIGRWRDEGGSADREAGR